MIPGAAPMPEKSVAMLHCEVADSGLLKIDRIGAGVGVIIYDRAHHIGAGLHVLAAYSGDSKPQNPFMFANTAVPQVFTEISEKGGRAPFSVAIAGGAIFLGAKTEQNTGQLIIEAAREALKKVGLEITLEQTGDNKIRCMVLDIDGGKIKIT
jgi:chemotaxis receptor (MCP) glutamine deamidase CheD